MSRSGREHETSAPPTRFVRLISLLLLTIPLAGCYAPLQRTVAERDLVATARYDLVPGIIVPHVRGADGCGAQALAAVLSFHDPTSNPHELGDALPWHDVGATPVDLLLEARRRGADATISRGDMNTLATLVASGVPALVMFDAGPSVQTLTGRVPTTPIMHWGVVSGTSHDRARVTIAAPDARHAVIRRSEFEQRWSRSDFCTIVLAPPPP